MFQSLMRLARPLLPFYLLLALLCAQQAGGTHAISHALEHARQQDSSQPAQTACEQCEHYAQLGSALGMVSPALAPPSAAYEIATHIFLSYSPRLLSGAAARGPPALLQGLS